MSPLAPELVSAGAGTGKTYDIVERIVGAVAADIPIRRIAAITFTTRAAAELQRRLKRRLAEKGHLEASLEADAAYVSTIHAFCLRLVTEHPVESGVIPETRPIDERETETLLERAISEAMEGDPAVADDVRFISRECLMYDRDRGTSEEQLRKKIRVLTGKVRALAKGPAEMDPLAETNDRDLVSRLPALLDPAQIRKLLDPHLTRWADWWKKSGSAMKLTQKNAGNPDQIAALQGSGPIPLDLLWNCKLGVLGNPKWAEHDGIVGALKQSIEDSIPKHPEWQAWYRRYARALFRIAGEALRRYESLKSTLGVMDYSDMQTSALALMSATAGGKPFAEYLRSRFDLLVVDEFQDTSPLQFAMVEALRGATVQGRYVGDLKQAIYGWRDADSRLFQTLIKDAAKVDTLKENRRSRKNLVDFVNAVSRPLFGGIGLAYQDLDAKSVYVRDKVKAFGDEFTVLSGDSSKPKTAERLAHWLKALLADPTQKVWDPEAKTPRTLRAGDVAVLVRTNKDALRVAQALGKVGLPSSQAATGLGNRLEVQLFRALVATYSNPDNRLSMAAVLVSEVYGLSHAALQAAGELLKSPRAYYVEEVRSRVEKALDPESWAKIQRFYADQEDLKPRFRREPLPEVVGHMIERTRLRDRLAGKADWKLCLANLDLCRESVAEFLSASPRQLSYLGISGVGVEAFLAWFDLRLGPEEEIAQTRPVDEEAVQVMTIHKSKGLEFPITVIHSLDAGVAPRLDRVDMVRPDSARGRDLLEKAWIRVFPGSFRPVPEAALLKDAVPDALADAVRNLYVAMTRAQERLVLVWPLDVDPDSYAQLLQTAGLAPDGAKLQVGKESFTARSVAVVQALPPLPPPAQDHRALALGAPDPKDYAFEETPKRETGGLARLSPTLLCRMLDDPETFYREEVCGVEHRGPVKRPITIKIDAAPLPGVAGPAPAVQGRADLGNLMHRALAAELDIPETLRRVEAMAGPAVRTYAECVLGPIRAHLESLKPTGPLLFEYPFLYRIGESVLSGVLDIGVTTREGLWIYDLKTNDITATEVPLYAQYYAPQLWSYALGAARAGMGRVAGLRLLFASPGVLATVPLCPKDFEDQVTASLKRLSGIDRGERDELELPRNRK